MSHRYDILAIGNAIVDIICRCDDNFLDMIGAVKGTMSLVETSHSTTAIYRRLKPCAELAGGSASNTAVGLSSLGGRAAFIGNVAEDDFGRIFRHDLRNVSVTFAAPSHAGCGQETSHTLVLVTADGQRTMRTFLGCSSEIDRGLINLEVVKNSKIVLLEGYLFDKPTTALALRRAVSLARVTGARVALTLSDPHCVARHRNEILALVRSGVEIVIGNEVELMALLQASNVDEAAGVGSRFIPTLVLTRSAKGSAIFSKGQAIHVPPEPVKKVVDLTGAGDLYAAGFLYGLSHGMDLSRAGRLGSFAASEILGQFGARPESHLGHLARLRCLIN